MFPIFHLSLNHIFSGDVTVKDKYEWTLDWIMGCSDISLKWRSPLISSYNSNILLCACYISYVDIFPSCVTFNPCWMMTVLRQRLVQWRVFPLSGQCSSDQIIWSDPVEWNGVREGQPVVLCFSLCSNVIRAHWERHGLDCNPPAYLSPSLSYLFSPSLSLSLWLV